MASVELYVNIQQTLLNIQDKLQETYVEKCDNEEKYTN